MAERGSQNVQVAVDLDRCFTAGWLPFATMKALASGKFHLPDSNPTRKKNKKEPSKGIDYLHYRYRWIRRDARKYLPKIQELIMERGYGLNTAVLSGRGEHRRNVTEKKLRKAGCAELFDSAILNNQFGSSISKEKQVKEWLIEGKNVIVFEDNLEAALCEDRAYREAREEIGENAGSLLIYVVNNPLTNPFYRTRHWERNHIIKPPYLHVVKSFKQAYRHLNESLRDLRQVA